MMQGDIERTKYTAWFSIA